ncbi:Anthocyanidin reductase, partial [Dichanthelium oligosanthes]
LHCTPEERRSPAISSTGNKMKTACVTGGSGYIASALIKMLLEKGYAVKTTVRNPGLMILSHPSFRFGPAGAWPPGGPPYRADLDVEGSFDDAIAGCDYAFLVAAPVNLSAGEDPEKELIEPAVRGTLNVMRSCVKAGTVRRVILTSSASAVYIRPELQGDGHVLDEDSWSDVEYLRAEKPPTWGYCVSKVLVEEAACRFAQEHGVSLVTVCPVITVGAAPSVTMNTSVPNCLSLLSGDEVWLSVLKAIERTSGSVPLSHVDDLCCAELFVAEEEAAAGRYICCSLSTTVAELARFLAQKYPQYDVKRNLHTDEQLLEKPRACLSSAKLVREGFEFKHSTLDEIYDNVVDPRKLISSIIITSSSSGCWPAVTSSIDDSTRQRWWPAMSAGEKKKTACVTGGNGYIASALIKMLLEEGYAVKTTVRNPDDMEKNSHLKGLQELGPLTVLRADLDEEGSFDDAVAGCDYAFLVAAPVNLAAEDPEKEQIEPSVRGTLNVMRSCVKAGAVRRVILTSSAGGVYIRPELQGDGHVLDEESWSDVEYLTANKPPTWGYCVSKVLLEKEACRFAEEHGISLVTVCPVITVGPAPATKVRTSIVDILSLLSGNEAGLGVLKGIEKTSGAVQLVHVGDLCRAELFVAEEETAAGRYICCGLNTTIVELARFLAQKYPQYGVKTDL